MGAGLVKAAYYALAAAGASHAAARVFVYMANTALDDDPRPSYFGGRDALAEALGTDHDEAGHRAVARIVQKLTGLGLIVAQGHQGPRRPARYLLHDGFGEVLRAAPNTGRSASSVTYSQDAQRHLNTGRSVSEQVSLSVRTGVTQRRPEEEEEKKEGTRASAPTRTCHRHSSWEHSEPCRFCAADRRTAASFAARRRPDTMSKRNIDCGEGKHQRFSDGTCLYCEDRDPLWSVA